MEKNLKNFITTVINTVDMDKEARKALLLNNSWMECVVKQIFNRLPKENIKKHLANVVNNIANYSRNNYPYPGYLDIVDTPNKVAIKIATDYVNYVISSRTRGADFDIEYDAYQALCQFDTSAGIREHTSINLSEVYKDTDPEYFEQFFINNTLTKVTKMIEILFKSEELLIAADSESKVIYGNTTKSSAVEYLNELTPKSSEEAMGIIMLIVLITKSKYVVAKKISVTTTTEVTVKAVKPSVVKTAEDALRIADKFDLKAEVQKELDNGATPLEALKEWDII